MTHQEFSPWLRLGLFALLGGALGACANDATCDEGERLAGGYCLPGAAPPEDKEPVQGRPDSGGASMGEKAADAAPPEGDPVDPFACKPGEDTGIEFGDECKDGEQHSDCGCPAPVCTAQGSGKGFCTQVQCDKSSDICPEDWRCMDLTALVGPDVPHTCLP